MISVLWHEIHGMLFTFYNARNGVICIYPIPVKFHFGEHRERERERAPVFSVQWDKTSFGKKKISSDSSIG